VKIEEMPTVDEAKHTVVFQCRNCGACCGPVPFTRYDRAKIITYLITRFGIDYLEKLHSQEREPLTCEYRDIEARKCAIHPVRPEICRMMGFYKGLECPHQPQFAMKSRDEGKKRLLGVTEL